MTLDEQIAWMSEEAASQAHAANRAVEQGFDNLESFHRQRAGEFTAVENSLRRLRDESTVTGEEVAGVRAMLGWSQEQMASGLGVTQQAVSKWESGNPPRSMSRAAFYDRLMAKPA